MAHAGAVVGEGGNVAGGATDGVGAVPGDDGGGAEPAGGGRVAAVVVGPSFGPGRESVVATAVPVVGRTRCAAVGLVASASRAGRDAAPHPAASNVVAMQPATRARGPIAADGTPNYDAAFMGPTFRADELLLTDAITAPLIVAGRRCHGGFDRDGRYVSPRSKVRTPAIAAWQEAHQAAGGTLLEAPIDEWPEPYPNIAQTRWLLAHDVREPVITVLTRVGTVEGFGGLIREVLVPDIERHFADSIAGTATAHLGHGLFEAHARDEAGHGADAGHNEMWFAARDLAFGAPSDDEITRILQTMGITPGAAPARGPALPPMFPELDPPFESMVRFMIALLFIEVSAFHVFAWAEDILGDADLVGSNGDAAAIVRCIRADETPHVEYLRTAISEMRDRTLVGPSGTTLAGAHAIDTWWETAKAASLGPRRELARASTLAEVERAVRGRREADDILAGFHAREHAAAA